MSRQRNLQTSPTLLHARCRLLDHKPFIRLFFDGFHLLADLLPQTCITHALTSVHHFVLQSVFLLARHVQPVALGHFAEP
jgi:hypothetical protein